VTQASVAPGAEGAPRLAPKPPWIRVRAPSGQEYEHVRGLVRGLRLHTVCEEAHCPNLGECWSSGTATFMILGEVCTRRAPLLRREDRAPGGAAGPGRAAAGRRGHRLDEAGARRADVGEPRRSAGWGARVFAACVHAIRARAPGCRVEVLIPDFKGDAEALETSSPLALTF